VDQPVARLLLAVLHRAARRADALQRAIHQHYDELVRIRGGDAAVRGHCAICRQTGISRMRRHAVSLPTRGLTAGGTGT